MTEPEAEERLNNLRERKRKTLAQSLEHQMQFRIRHFRLS